MELVDWDPTLQPVTVEGEALSEKIEDVLSEFLVEIYRSKKLQKLHFGGYIPYKKPQESRTDVLWLGKIGFPEIGIFLVETGCITDVFATHRAAGGKAMKIGNT